MEVEGGMLFAGRQTLDSYLDMRRRQIPEIVNDLQDQELTDTSDSVLLRRILQNVEVDLIILRSNQEQIKRFQSEIDVSREPGRFPRINERGPCFQPATTTEHVIPFSGPAELFELKIGSSSRKLPRGWVEGGQIIISCRVANDRFDNASEEFKKEVKGSLVDQKQRLEVCVTEVNRMIGCHNQCCSTEADQVLGEVLSE